MEALEPMHREDRREVEGEEEEEEEGKWEEPAQLSPNTARTRLSSSLPMASLPSLVLPTASRFS